MGKGALQAALDRSLRDPAGFWGEAAEAVYWYKKWEKVLDDSHRPFYRWFVGGEVNTCYNALDLHIENGRGDQPALIYDSPVTDSVKTFTYRELRDKVATFAGALAHLGVGKRRSRNRLYADGSRSGCGNACLRPLGGGAFCGVRRFRCKRTG